MLKNIGQVAGFLSGIFFMSTVWFLILRLSGRIPQDFGYFQVLIIVILVVISGLTLTKYLNG
ncbi:hypothetical protein HYS93_01370 [Candidatus Daviesbacteria bacterium]|nr:hypothetical protein [Candidatus Daviesbacteria bacterium]